MIVLSTLVRNNFSLILLVFIASTLNTECSLDTFELLELPQNIFLPVGLKKFENKSQTGVNVKISSIEPKTLRLVSNISFMNTPQNLTFLHSTNQRFSTYLGHDSFYNLKEKSQIYFKGDARAKPISGWIFLILKLLDYIENTCKGKMECFCKQILQGLDRLIEVEKVQIVDGVFLVKEQEGERNVSPENDSEPFLLAVTRRVVKVFETHAIRVRLGVMKESVSQARIGHHGYKHAFPLMVGSFMILAAFMVPMGFQFLAVVGGKALVLSQIALVMAMRSSLQRYLGLGNYRQGGGGIVPHDYYLRDDIQPWHRVGTDTKYSPTYFQDRQSYQHQKLTQQELQGLINYQKH